jgi:hypothetical protein
MMQIGLGRLRWSEKIFVGTLFHELKIRPSIIQIKSLTTVYKFASAIASQLS